MMPTINSLGRDELIGDELEEELKNAYTQGAKDFAEKIIGQIDFRYQGLEVLLNKVRKGEERDYSIEYLQAKQAGLELAERDVETLLEKMNRADL